MGRPAEAVKLSVQKVAPEPVGHYASSRCPSPKFTSARALKVSSPDQPLTPFDVRKSTLFASPGVNHRRSEPIKRSKLSSAFTSLNSAKTSRAGSILPAKRKNEEGGDGNGPKRPLQ